MVDLVKNPTRLILLLLSTTFFIWFFGGASPALGQDVGGFRGNVTDATGAVVTNAAIKATEEKSGVSNSTTTNAVGEYELGGLLPGTYTLEVTAPAFRGYRDTSLVLYNREVRRVDVVLAIGSVESTVEVRGQASTIQTDTATVGYETGHEELYGLNLASSLIYRVADNPGAESRSQVHGGFANQTNAEQDGIATNAYGSWRAPQETTQEVYEVALNAPAEYRTSAAVIGVGKRGNNSLHAEVFANYQNTALDALSVGETSRPASRPVIQYSYEFSGPVFIPKVYNGKNKTFFHFLFQPQSAPSTPVFHQYFVVPTEKMRAGDLSEYAAFRNITIKDPYNDVPFPNNTIPASMISPVAKNILNLLPLPNNGPPGSLANNFNWTDYSSDRNRWWQFSLQHQLTSKNNVSVTYYRYTNNDSEELQGNPFPDAGFLENDWTNGLSVQDIHVFSPRVLNEFEFTWNRQHSIWAPGSVSGKDFLNNILGITNTGGIKLSDALGSPRVVVQTLGEQLGVLSSGYNPFPSLLIGTSGAAPISGSANYTDGYVWQWRDNVSYNRGRHLFKTGVEVRFQTPFELNGVTGDTFGRFTFTGNFTGYDYGDLLLGLPYQTDINAIRPTVQAREWEIGGFVQDVWKVTPRLTITPGVRFQHYGVPYEANNLEYNFDLATQQVVVPNAAALQQVVQGYPIPVVTAAQAGYPERLQSFKQILVDPRLGIAYRPFEKTVFRVAYGIYHVPYASNAAWAAANVFGDVDRAGLLAGLVNGPYQSSQAFGPNQIVNGVPEFTLSNPFPGGQIGLQDVYSSPVNNRKNAWPYDQQWNMTIERELRAGFSLRTSYVGSKGTDWPYVQDLQIPQASTTPFNPANRPFGNQFNSVNVFQLGGNSDHEGLEVAVSRQFASGLYFRAWYGWLKTLNDVQGGLFGSTTGAFPEDPYDRSRDKGWQEGVIPHQARIMAVYELPFGRGQRFGGSMPGVLNKVFGNWTAVPIYTVSADQRFTPTFSGADPTNTGTPAGGTDAAAVRPDAICNGDHFGSGPGLIWNPACFTIPANGQYGTASRGSLSGPLVWDIDFNVFKRFNLVPGKENGPYCKVEMYSTDLLNHHNSSGPLSTDITSPEFGLFIPGGNRSIYFRVRVGF